MSRFQSEKYNQSRNRRHSIAGGYYFLTTTTLGRKQILSSSEVAEGIFETFEWLEDQGRIRWICLVVMPDHIHAVVQLGSGQTLAKVIHSVKMFTARQINEQRGERGSVWQEGYYDHGVRGDEALNGIIQYCYDNPVKTGLVKQAKDYPYWWCKFQME